MSAVARIRSSPSWWLPLACLAVAGISLLGAHSPTYDPWAWLVWGREIVHADLSTSFGPSWKPLPVAFTTVFSLLGDGPAPLLWLVVARTAGLLAIVLAYRLAARLAGPLAGVLAAAGLLFAERYLATFWRGDSEGMLVALALWAVERHLDGHRRQVLAIGVGAALLRPEVWPFLALYGGWLVVGERHGPRRWSTTALVVGCGIGVLVVWLLPEYLGSGDWTRAASRAREPVADSPGQSDFPFGAVFTNSVSAVAIPVYVGWVLAAGWAVRWWRRAPSAQVVGALAGAAVVLMLEVGALAQVGFTGNLRYVTLAASLVCVVAGVGWAVALRWARRRVRIRWTAATVGACVLACIPVGVSVWSSFHASLDMVGDEARVSGLLSTTIARAGGRRAVTACGSVATGPLQTQIVAWYLHLRENQVHLRPELPGTIVATVPSSLARTPGYRTLGQTAHGWRIAASCGA
jgi:hypothetical protein